jgi:iron complex transport system substrate-binding protein
VLLLACGNQAQPTGNNSSASTAPSPEASANSAGEVAAATQSYTDYIGHTVEIPTAPQRIIFVGETYGDLLALGVQATGTAMQMTANQIYADQVVGVEDVGFPINLEKTLALQPDLIIYADTDEADFEALSKITPTIIFNTLPH